MSRFFLVSAYMAIAIKAIWDIPAHCNNGFGGGTNDIHNVRVQQLPSEDEAIQDLSRKNDLH
jgi:hypothetical protein